MSLSGPEELVFDLSTKGGGQEVTVGSVIADNSYEGVDGTFREITVIHYIT